MTDLSTMTREQLLAHIATMQAAPARRITMKITAKREDGTGTDGALSIYGLGRFPTTMYRSQWERLLAERDAILAFIETNSALLTVKA